MEKISELITWQIVVFLAEEKKKKKAAAFDSEWHWSIWHQQLLRWRHEWLLFKQASELSRLALQFITLLAFSRQSWRKNLHFHCTCLQRSQGTWLILAHTRHVYGSWGQKSWLSLLFSSQHVSSPKVSSDCCHQGRAMLSPSCHTYQF